MQAPVHLLLCAASFPGQNPCNPADVDALLADFADPAAPGCALAIVENGEPAYTGARGLASLEHEVAIGADTVFRAGSLARPFTATCIFLLEQDGALSLDDDVRTWIPELADYRSPLTLRHLLHHTSGIRDYPELMRWAGIGEDERATAGQVAGMLFRQAGLNSAPGEVFEYGESEYFLLGLVVARASRTSLRSFAHERIFAPLDMTSTRLRDDAGEVVPRLAAAYRRRTGELVFGRGPVPRPTFEHDPRANEIVGARGVVTTVGDLARWEANLCRPAAGQEGLLAFLTTPAHVDGRELGGYTAVLTLDEYRGRRIQLGCYPLARHRTGAQMVRLPDQGLTVICLANDGNGPPTGLCKRVADVGLAEMPVSSPRQRVSWQQARAQGTWIAGAGDRVLHLTSGPIRLWAQLDGEAFALAPVGEWRLRKERPPGDVGLAFREDDQGRLVGELSLRGDPPIPLRRVDGFFEPTLQELQAYAGIYYSPELDAWTC